VVASPHVGSVANLVPNVLGRGFGGAVAAAMLWPMSPTIASCLHLAAPLWAALFPMPRAAFTVPASARAARVVTAPSSSPPPPPSPSSPSPEVAGRETRAGHMLLVDTHADTTQRIVYQGQGAAFFDGIPGAHLDLPKMRAGGVDAQFFSIFVPPKRTPSAAFFSEALVQIKALQDLVSGSHGRLALARTAADVRENAARGVPSVLFGVEGGHALGIGSEGEQLAHLTRLASEGVRYMTLTWTNSNSIGGSSGDDGDSRGLTEFGRRVLNRMQKLGVLIDLSHASDPLFWDAIRYAKKPVILSHSSARALANVPRNISDAMLRAVKQNGGAVCANYNPAFLDAEYAKKQAPLWAAARDLPLEAGWRQVQEGSAKLPPVPLTRLADHIMHMIEVAGVDHVCLGSDFDGIPAVPAGLEDASHMPALAAELTRRGVSASDLRKVWGANTLRVLESSEAR
jgi:membrane dipeptidase